MKNTWKKIVTYLKEHRPVAICGGSILALVFVVCIIVAVISNSNKDSVVDAQIPSVNTESQNVAINTSTTESEKDSVQTEMPETTATESQQPVETQETQETQVPTETQETQVSNETQKQDSQKEQVKEPVKEPEKKPEKKPVKEPEKESQKESQKEPVKEPEKESEKESEKEPEQDTRKPWEIDFEGYKASCVEVTNKEDFDPFKGFDEDLDFMEQYEILRMLNYDYPDGKKAFDHELCVITTRWYYNLAGEKLLRTGYYTYKEIDAPWPVEEYELDLWDLGIDSIQKWGYSCFLIKEYSQTEPTLAFAYYKEGR